MGRSMAYRLCEEMKNMKNFGIVRGPVYRDAAYSTDAPVILCNLKNGKRIYRCYGRTNPETEKSENLLVTNDAAAAAEWLVKELDGAVKGKGFERFLCEMGFVPCAA